jgi:hypothetical protein
MRADLKALADILIQAVRAAVSPVVKRIDEIDEAVKDLPKTVAADLDDRVQKAVSALPPPADGKDFPAEKVERMVSEAVLALPKPKDGEDGSSVTVEDLEPLVGEVVAKAVADLPAPKDGESVPIEDVRKMVDEEVAKALAAVAPARDGEPGRDALQLELQPAIDLEKSYVRGTYAKHDGGLWRAFEATKGLRGWECVVEGIADLRVEQPSAREFVLIARTSSGAEVSKSIKVAALVDKGIFRADTEYEAGDGVTWGGSFFIAQKDLPLGKPGEPGCDGWRLAVKRGRDAGKGISV